MTVQAIAKEAITLGLIMTDPNSSGMASKEAFKHFMRMKERLTMAGAGGRALALAESDNGGESMADEQTEVIEEQQPAAEPVEEPLEEVTLSEQEEPEPETPPEPLAHEKVREMVDATSLPDAAKAKLSEAEYADEEAVKAAIAAEVAYIKEVTGSGKPFAAGAGSAPERKPRTAEEADADWNRILTEVGMPYLVGGK